MIFVYRYGAMEKFSLIQNQVTKNKEFLINTQDMLQAGISPTLLLPHVNPLGSLPFFSFSLHLLWELVFLFQLWFCLHQYLCWPFCCCPFTHIGIIFFVNFQAVFSVKRNLHLLGKACPCQYHASETDLKPERQDRACPWQTDVQSFVSESWGVSVRSHVLITLVGLTDWWSLIDDRLYSAVLCSLEQTHCAPMWSYMSD